MSYVDGRGYRLQPLNVIGIDDWAWRRNHRYGTIVCDLERHRPVTLLPDREQATATAWLEGHQEITVVARDRGGGYGEAVARALPQAVQVADRWHLLENASRAFLDAVRRMMRQFELPLAPRRSIPSYSPLPSVFNTKAINGGKRSMRPFLRWQKMSRSRKSFVVSATAVSSFVGSFGESGRTFSAPGRAPWSGTSLGSMHNGLPGAAMERTSGGVSKSTVFVAPSVSSPSGRPGGDVQKELTRRACNASPRHVPSLV